MTRAITAVRGVWSEDVVKSRQCVYFANHNSHGDFMLIWAVLPPDVRAKTRPVAGSDYWMTSRLKRFIGRSVFNSVLIDRHAKTRDVDPIAIMADALDSNNNLILFPEGTRNATDELLLPFKSGLFHLAKARPEIDLIPVWIENLNRVLPKGALIPVPLICTVNFGTPISLNSKETKENFLSRAESALKELSSSD